MNDSPTVGLHDFLNSKPILWAFSEGIVEAPFNLVTGTPSELAMRFNAGELDMALIPSVEYGRNTDALIVPELCIASKGPVETVLLFTEKKIETIKTVAVDPKSRTSVAAMIIMLKELYNIEPESMLATLAPDNMPDEADAGLIIGDQAYLLDHERFNIFDLGEMWLKLTGMPFVHAIMCARPGINLDEAINAIKMAKKEAPRLREAVAKDQSLSPTEEAKFIKYLTNHIYYDFGGDEQAGLENFLSRAYDLGLVFRTELKFYNNQMETTR